MFEQSLPISLIKAVGEAAVAYRTGSDTYVVVHREYPHDRQVFYTYDGSGDPKGEAVAWLHAREDASDWTIIGPIVTETEEPASRSIAPDFKVTVEGRDANGASILRTYDGEIDALFLTLPAIDKFLIPYYTHVYGIEKALKIREEILQQEGAVITGHVWSSKFIPA